MNRPFQATVYKPKAGNPLVVDGDEFILQQIEDIGCSNVKDVLGDENCGRFVRAGLYEITGVVAMSEDDMSFLIKTQVQLWAR